MIRTILWRKQILVLLALSHFLAAGTDDFKLPSAVAIELKRLEETYHVLDLVADEVWPGWNNYKDFPFLLKFENGLRILVGHPSPPSDFELYPDLKVADKTVYIDRKNMTSLELIEPLSGGGGILPYGQFEGKTVYIVDLDFRRMDLLNEEPREEFQTEKRILMNIHELFHCFQRDNVKMIYPNLSYNPDANCSIYSEIEGLALEKAYRSADDDEAKEYLKDFVVAREYKRRSMSEAYRQAESSDDVREGTAVYSEVRTLEGLKQGFNPELSPEKDLYYSGFKNINSLLESYLERLRESQKESYDIKMKCYTYGCFQALLLQRFFLGWQEPFSQDAHFLDEEIKSRITISEEEYEKRQKKFEKKYGLKEIRKRQEEAIGSRDKAYQLISSLKGRTYVISFKAIRQYLGSLVGKKRESYPVGLIRLFPHGIGTITLDDIKIESKEAPAEINQLFYLKFIDTDWEKREKPYSLRYERKEQGNIYVNAILTTPHFTLQAPELIIKERGNRIKITILSRLQKYK